MSKISDWKAVYMIVNIFVGLGLLSKPYALAQGGWISLIGLTIASMIACLNAILIIECFKMSQNDIISYPQLGYEAMGTFGKWYIQIIIYFEIGSYVIIILIVLWANISYIFPSISYIYIVLGSCALFLPILWMSTIRTISFLSFIGVLSNLFIFGTVFVLFLSKPNIQTEYHFWTDMKGLSISIGIYIVALGGHIAIPTIYKSMKHPAHIKRVIIFSFFLIWIIYIGIAIFGYLFFGKGVSIIITKDIKTHSSSYYFVGIVSLVLIKLYCTIPTLLFVIFKETEINTIRKGCKLFLFLLIGYISYLIHNTLPLIEALSGTLCTMNTSMILPLLLYILLRYQREKKGYQLLPLQQNYVIQPFKWWKYIGYFILLGLNITITTILFINDI